MKAVKDEAVLSGLDQLEADVIEQFNQAYDALPLAQITMSKTVQKK